MKPHLRHIALLVLVVATPAATLAACEGEPPVGYPQNASGVPPQAVPPPEVAMAATAEAPSTTSPAPMPCMDRSPSTPAAASATASADGGATSPVASAASTTGATPSAPEAAALAHEGSLLGSITTKPAALAAYGAVYLEDGPTEGAPPAPASVTIANRQMAFRPFLAVIPAGGKVVFTNADPFPHNVFSSDNGGFNIGLIQQNEARARLFAKPGAYSLLCNLHPGMLGYLLVTPSAWFARTDANGKFALPHVPNGTYKLTAWAPRQAPITQNVTVADGDVTLHIDLHR
jgi:plastocyanin